MFTWTGPPPSLPQGNSSTINTLDAALGQKPEETVKSTVDGPLLDKMSSPLKSAHCGIASQLRYGIVPLSTVLKVN